MAAVSQQMLLLAQGLTFPATSYSNTGGTGARSGVITLTTTFTAGAGSAANLIDGAIATGYFLANATATGHWLFDFGGSPKFIDELKWYQTADGALGDFVLEASQDNASWTTIANINFLNVTTQAYPFTPPVDTKWRYFRLRANSSSTVMNGPYLNEIEFKIST